MCTHGEKGNRKTQDKLRTCATKRTIPWAMPSGPAEAAGLRQERRASPTKAVPEFLQCERRRAHGLVFRTVANAARSRRHEQPHMGRLGIEPGAGGARNLPPPAPSRCEAADEAARTAAAAQAGAEPGRRSGARQVPRLVPPADLTTTGRPMLARGSELRGSS